MDTIKNRHHTRRIFLKSALAVSFGALVVIWDRMIFKQKKISQPRNAVVNFDPNKQVNFSGDYIVIKNGQSLSVYSSRCTHLGCKINNLTNFQLLCPCHGSAYDLSGKVIKGPALSSLKKMEFKIQDQSTLMVSV